MVWSNYSLIFYSEIAKGYLLYSTLSNMLVKVDADTYDEIMRIKENPERIGKTDEKYKFLFDGRFIVSSNTAEYNKILLHNLNLRYNSSALSLTIAPTRSCNFACPYCYEKSRLTNKEMSTKVMDQIVSYVRKHYNDRKLCVVWYGGEPTEAVSAISYLSPRLKDAAQDYEASMITNGYNLDRIINQLEEYCISNIQITLDGPKRTHNQTRILRRGGDSYDKIIENIDRILNTYTNIHIAVRMNITRQNANEYEELREDLICRFGNRIFLYPAFVHDYDGICNNNTYFDNITEKSEFISELYHTYGIYSPDLFIIRRNKGCSCHSNSSLIVGPEGELYKCWHHLGIPEKSIGTINADLEITNVDLYADYMINGDALFDVNCKKCVLFPSCNGGCADLKKLNKDYCITAKGNLEKYIEIRYHQLTNREQTCAG
jgi:uncharacterized protein